jgi:hypothetical protein
MDAVSKLLTRRQGLPQKAAGSFRSSLPLLAGAAAAGTPLTMPVLPKINSQRMGSAAGTFISYLFYLSAAAILHLPSSDICSLYDNT